MIKSWRIDYVFQVWSWSVLMGRLHEAFDFGGLINDGH